MEEEKREKEARQPLKLHACPSPLSDHKGHASLCQTYQVPSCLGAFARFAFMRNAFPRAGSSKSVHTP